MVRLFIGVMIPKDLRSRLIQFQKELDAVSVKAKFVEPENLHISLSFLGDVGESRVDEIKSILDTICKNHEKLDVVIRELLLIPNRNFVRVVALNVVSESLEILRKEIAKNIGGESYRAHLTLCRINSIVSKKDFLNFTDKLNFGEIIFNIDSISLVQSFLGKDGPVYKSLHESYLSK